MPLSSVEDLYLRQLIDLHGAETEILQALPLMAKLAPTTSLQQAFAQHYQQTIEHINRLEQIIAPYGVQQRPNATPGIMGIIQEGQHITTLIDEALTLELALIAAAQRVENYEIAAYRSVHSLANVFGEPESVALLEQTLAEEQATDMLLSSMATEALRDQPASVNRPYPQDVNSI